MRSISETLLQLEDFVHLKGAASSDIEAAERELQTVFACDYRDYLAIYGIASGSGHELTGICDFPRLNVVDVTNDERGRGLGEDPSWYVIEQIGFDGLVAWQAPDGPVFLTAMGIRPRKVAESMVDYLSK